MCVDVDVCVYTSLQSCSILSLYWSRLTCATAVEFWMMASKWRSRSGPIKYRLSGASFRCTFKTAKTPTPNSLAERVCAICAVVCNAYLHDISDHVVWLCCRSHPSLITRGHGTNEVMDGRQHLIGFDITKILRES